MQYVIVGNMSKTFYTSDLHFGHANIIKYCNRPFSSVGEMDEAMIAQWNSVVSTEDTVFVLGDYAMGDRKRGLSYLLRMNGTKILINGNHDKLSAVNNKSWKYQREYLNDEDGNELFHAVQDFSEVSLPSLVKNAKNRRVLLSHYPYTGDHEDRNDRYSQFRFKDEGKTLLHGHIHDEAWIQKSSSGATMFNVGVDVNGFLPIEAQGIHRLIQEFEDSGDNAWEAPEDQFRKVKNSLGKRLRLWKEIYDSTSTE